METDEKVEEIDELADKEDIEFNDDRNMFKDFIYIYKDNK